VIVSICCALLSLRQDPASASVARPATPAKLISQAFQHYADATSIGGHIRLTQSAQNVTVRIDTDVAYDLPNLLYIQQIRGGSDPRRTIIVSDGKHFSYDKPKGTFGPPRFVEDVQQAAGSQDVKEMYGTSAITLDDRTVTDIAFARNVDLREVSSQWSNLKYGPKATVRNIEANEVDGEYSETPGKGVTGTFALVISDAGDILQYTVRNRYAVPQHPDQSVVVTSVWDVDLTVNAKNDPKLYKTKG